MHDDKNPAPPKLPGAARPPGPSRPAYEPPRVTRKKTVQRATLFTGGGGPSSAPLVSNG